MISFHYIEQKLCHNNPCVNGGHCHEVDDVFHCKCPLGFFGRICDSEYFHQKVWRSLIVHQQNIIFRLEKIGI